MSAPVFKQRFKVGFDLFVDSFKFFITGISPACACPPIPKHASMSPKQKKFSPWHSHRVLSFLKAFMFLILIHMVIQKEKFTELFDDHIS